MCAMAGRWFLAAGAPASGQAPTVTKRESQNLPPYTYQLHGAASDADLTMNGVIEALHIYDEHNHAILSHTYTGRPLSAQHLLPLYLEHPAPRPNVLYLPNTSPPTLVFSLKHANLLFLATSSSDIEPLLVLEFIHRIIDVFEEFLGAPLLAHKIESNYDVVAQLLNEMCDAGNINTTEPNALRDLVEVEGWVGKLLGSINLPGYEVDLLPFTSGKSGNISSNNLKLPVNIEMKTGLGPTGSDFEVRLHVNKVLGTGGPSAQSQYGRGGGGAGRGFGGPHAGTPASPLMEDLIVTVPLPVEVRNLPELRPSKGDASFSPGEKVLEWHIPTKELSVGTSYFGLRCTVVGQLPDDEDDELDPTGFGFGKSYAYDEPYQATSPVRAKKTTEKADDEKDAKKVAQNKMLMPSSASVSFSVKGWLPSGLKVESILIDPRKSKGLGEGVKPYKGVKYLTVSKGGVETRCQGVQKVGMITPWLEAFPTTAKPILEEIDHYMGYKLSDIIANGPGKLLTKTPNAQPAIMATSILILRILEREFGFDIPQRVDVTLGHSLGEFAALVAGGYLEFEDSLYLVRKRAEAMHEATRRAVDEYGGEYGMVAIVTEPEYLKGLIEAIHDFVGHSSAGSKGESSEDVPPIEQVLIANINSKNQIVLSGNIERIKTLATHVRQFLGHDPRAVRLNSDSPFHSPIMKPAVSVVKSILNKKSRVKGREGEDIITFPGKLPCISNVSARPFESKEDVKDLLARQCLETVRWWDSIKYLDQEEKVRRWIGIGPGKVGRNLVGKEVGMRGKDSVKGGGVWAITDPNEIEEVLKGLEDTEHWSDDDAE
ncbi:Malonyl CoA-acyl carrier protein transacylase [Colletotrichum sp. SAR11_57]|nr:Malonyl CoA-acyl carrier protein transacylase [Colletotrichum sp. SAR11_57]